MFETKCKGFVFLGIESLLPFLLLQDSGSDNLLLLLVLFGGFGGQTGGTSPFVPVSG